MDKDKAIETWKPVVGWEANYLVNNNGKVKGLSGLTTHNYGGDKIKKECVLRPVAQNNGYYSINLSVRGRRKTVFIHRVVAISFIPNPEKKPCVNHKNGVKSDNRVENLEWVTYSENEIHSYTVLKKVNPRKGKRKSI